MRHVEFLRTGSFGKSGFTLTELLVVMAVISILAGLLVPALGRAKARAQGILCLNHCRQMALAWRLYAEDHDERIPGARAWEPGPGRFQPDWTGTNWLSLTDPADECNWNVDQYNKRSVLWPYCGGTLEIWRCPADRSIAVNAEGRTVPRLRTLSMNNWVGGDGWTESGDWRPASPRGWMVYLKLSDMNDPGPAQTWVFLDEREDSINDGYFIIDMQGFPGEPARRRIVDYPASYHNGSGSLAFADGHAEARKWVDTRTLPALNRKQNLRQNIDSPGNLDVLWLQERSTRE